jgi:sugar (pentulose or hexulose) kinase
VGLNLGAQIHWQFTRDTSLRDRTKAIITYPQYWGHRLTGVLASDVSSLGCHTDLWNPYKAEFSSLADHLEIRDKLAPARKSTDVLGSLLPDIASRTGLRPDTPVLCGIHDSNASLLTHIMRCKPPFSVVSTGTWVIAMSVGGSKVVLDPARDALVNVSGLGEPIPSARFMGGREYEVIRAGQSATCDAAVLSAVAENGPLLMPAVVPESGPFQGRMHHWIGSEPEQGTPERIAALSFYLALMTAECLSLTGHRGPIVVEGPFATNNGYCEMLRAATNWPIFVSESATGTSQGAALLSLKSDALPESVEPSPLMSANDPSYRAYAERWRRAAVI